MPGVILYCYYNITNTTFKFVFRTFSSSIVLSTFSKKLDKYRKIFACINCSMILSMTSHCPLQYYLVDDTLEIREVHDANDGRDPFPVLICRHKVHTFFCYNIITSVNSSESRYHLPSPNTFLFGC